MFEYVLMALSASNARAAVSSRAWPSKSTKKRYSPSWVRMGLDSILVRFMPRSAKCSGPSAGFPACQETENTMEVLSLPVGGTSSWDKTTNRVQLLDISSMFSMSIFKPKISAALLLAMAAMGRLLFLTSMAPAAVLCNRTHRHAWKMGMQKMPALSQRLGMGHNFLYLALVYPILRYQTLMNGQNLFCRNFQVSFMGQSIYGNINSSLKHHFLSAPLHHAKRRFALP